VLLLPVGIEGRAIRRLPWVTLAFVALNVLAFVVTWAAGAARQNEAALLRDLVARSLAERPYLAVGERLAKNLGADEIGRLRERSAGTSDRAIPAAERLSREQSELDALGREYLEALDRLPWHRFGFVPAQPSLLTALTAVFMHGGWLHLLGNMFLLWVSGPYVEDVLGRALYGVAYLASGLAATAGHYLASPHSTVPLVGASGAIAGVMGIVLVRLAASKIRFLFLPIVFLPNLRIMLSLPALVVLPLWFLQQLWSAQRPTEEGGGVAWWAHVAGFAFGAALALAVALLRIEERWLGRSAAVDEGRRALDDASEARLGGDLEAARRGVRRALAAEPDSAPAWLEAYELALQEADGAQIARVVAKLLELLPPRGGGVPTAEGLIEEARWREVGGCPPRLFLAVAAFLERSGHAAQAVPYYDQAISAAPDDAGTVRTLVRKAEALGRLGQPQAAREALQKARAHPACNEVWKGTVERALARIEQPPR
jgi:membrane associated rhomboid family serine protease